MPCILNEEMGQQNETSFDTNMPFSTVPLYAKLVPN